MGDKHDRGTDIRLSHTPEPLERPFTLPFARGTRALWDDVPRGPVSLLIEMPARSNLRGAAPLLVMVVGIIAFFEFVLGRIGAGIPTWANLAFLGFGLLVVMLFWGGLGGTFATREFLEIDSKVVTLRRGSVYICAWNRATFEDVRLAQPGTKLRVEGSSVFGGAPTIVWGFYPSGSTCTGGAGAGIHHAAADEVLSRIREFCAAHPCDPDSERVLGTWIVRSWAA